MSPDEQQHPVDRAAGPPTEEECRALLLRLLRLVAAEVAAQLQRPGSAAPGSRQPRGREQPPEGNRHEGDPALG
jgi:hypothetical protein